MEQEVERIFNRQFKRCEGELKKLKLRKKEQRHKEMIEKLDEIRCGLIDVEEEIKKLKGERK